MDKNFKIWGMSYGLIGDLIMGLPMLTYFEKKYPGSYKYWVIEKKCSVCAPLYFNHPLIDRIKITDEWSGFGEEDKRLMASADVKTTCEGWKHDRPDWYNVRSCVEETAIVAGISDFLEILKEEISPQLNKWFNVGFFNPKCHTYTKQYTSSNEGFKNNIAIWPFATAGDKTGRSPSLGWWKKVVETLISLGYTVYHYGMPTEPKITTIEGYCNFTFLSYFEQVQGALASKLTIGTDSGSMWVMGAYAHPAINLMTMWLKNHKTNHLALAPVNLNATNLFKEGGCDNITIDEILTIVKKKI